MLLQTNLNVFCLFLPNLLLYPGRRRSPFSIFTSPICAPHQGHFKITNGFSSLFLLYKSSYAFTASFILFGVVAEPTHNPIEIVLLPNKSSCSFLICSHAQIIDEALSYCCAVRSLSVYLINIAVPASSLFSNLRIKIVYAERPR